ncbi:hypothetical protein KUCAC02_021481, partial [Chaenocephalus aceratus]
EASLDSSSPDFVPSVFMYTKQSQNPNAKMDRVPTLTDRVAPSVCVRSCQAHCSNGYVCLCVTSEEDIPVPKREYDDLNMRYSQLQEEYVNLRQEFDTLRAENVKLKEELHKSTFSYTT